MLTSILQRHPIAVIPVIENAKDRRRGATRGIWVFVAFMLLLVAALAIIHFFYQPLDVLLDSLLESAGLV